MMLLVDFASYWLRWAVEASWQLAVLVCIVAIVSRLLRSASPRLRHGLWLLVLIKAFLPPMLTSPWSLGRLAAGALNRVGGSITI